MTVLKSKLMYGRVQYMNQSTKAAEACNKSVYSVDLKNVHGIFQSNFPKKR